MKLWLHCPCNSPEQCCGCWICQRIAIFIISTGFHVILSFFPFLSGTLHSATLHVLFTVGSKDVVELGSGLGLVGISSLLLFPLASFTFTDCHPWVLEALRENLQLQSVCTFALRYSQLSSIVSVPAVHIWCQIHEPLHHTSSVYTLQCYSQCFMKICFQLLVMVFCQNWHALVHAHCHLPLAESCCDAVVLFVCCHLCILL